MSEIKKDDDQVEAVIQHLKSLDKDALVAATLDMERAVRGDNKQDLPLWLRDVPREVVLQARQEITRRLERPEPETPENAKSN